MAALRYAARKLGDRALQRLQAIHTAAASTAAEEEGQRHLIRTVLPSSSRGAAKPPTRNTKHPCAKSAAEPLDEKKREYLVYSHLTQIQKKKEELFNLIAELDSKLPSRCTKDNRALLMDLSTQALVSRSKKIK